MYGTKRQGFIISSQCQGWREVWGGFGSTGWNATTCITTRKGFWKYVTFKHDHKLSCDLWRCENAKLIFGADVTSLKLKLVRRKPASIITDYVEIPWVFLESHKELEMSTEIMFVNNLPLTVIIRKGMKFTTIECLLNKYEILLVNSIKSCKML